MNLAQQKVREDGQFKFKKGKSRSKSIVKTSAEERQSRILHLERSLKEINAQINFKTQMRDRAQTVKEWKVCDNLTTEIRKIFKERADLEAELKILERKFSSPSGTENVKFRTIHMSYPRAKQLRRQSRMLPLAHCLY